MKKILVTAILFISFSAFSQVSLAPTKTKRISSVNNAHIEEVEKKRYDFFFKNMNATEHEFVKFSFRAGNTTDFNDIYNIIINGFETAVTDDVIKIKSNEEIIGMKYVNQNGIRVVQFLKYKDDGVASSRMFTIEEINELFKK